MLAKLLYRYDVYNDFCINDFLYYGQYFRKIQEILIHYMFLFLCRFLVGEKLTYVDLALLHVLRATAAQFPDFWKDNSGSFPLLVAFKSRLEQRPNLAAYFKSERCLPFSGNSMM